MSNKYWERRAAQRMFENMEEAEKAAEEVKKYYRASSEYLKSHAKNIFERYATKYGLTQVEARAMLDQLTKAKTVDEIINRLEEVEKGKGNLAKLDSPAYRHRIQRMMDLQQQVDSIMKKNYNLEKNYVDGFYERLIGKAYYKSLYETMQRIGFAVAFNHISEQQISDILRSKWYGKNYSERIWDNTQRLAEKLKEELFVCFVTGQTEKEAADKIGELFGQEYMVARRLIRTEAAWMTNQMDQKAYKEAEIEYYRFTAVLDLRTSMICRDMDGKIFKVSEAIIGKNHPPMHPWCRSTTTPIISQKYLDRMKRKFRNPETGEVETVPLSMTYKEWHDKYVKGTKAEEADQIWKKNYTPEEKEEISRDMAIRNGRIYGITTEGGKSVSKEALVKVDKAIHNMFKRHPELDGFIDKVLFVDKMAENEIAKATITRNKSTHELHTALKINKKLIEDNDAIDTLIKNSTQYFTEKQSIDDFFEHEATHFREYRHAIIQNTVNGVVDVDKAFEEIGSDKYSKEIVLSVFNFYGLEYNYDNIEKYISNYAKTYDADAVAEACSGGTNKVCKKIKKEVDKRWI